MFRFQRTVAIHKIVFLIILIGHVVIASPFRFDEASNDIQDFVIVNVTNCIRSSMIALMHKRIDEYSRPEDALMPSYYDHELGVERRRCLVALKGDRSLSGNKVCYLYLTPRMANVLPRIYISTGGVTGGPWEEGYFPNDKPVPGKMVILTGRQKWMYHPPYKPLSSYRDEFVQLMLLTPEHALDKARIVPNKYHYGHGTVMDFIDNNYKQAKPEELMAKLKIEMAFSIGSRLHKALKEGGMIKP